MRNALTLLLALLASLAPAATVSTSFTSVTNGNAVPLASNWTPAQTGTYSITGTFSATLLFQFSTDNVNWSTVGTYTTTQAALTFVIPGLYRWRCSAYTSGTAVCVIYTTPHIYDQQYNNNGVLVFQVDDTGTTSNQFFGPISGTVTATAPFEVTDSTDPTKILEFIASGNTTGTTLILSPSQSTSQTLTIPNITGADTLMTLGLATQTLSGNTASTSYTTGTLVVTGGVGVSGAGYWNSTLNVAGVLTSTNTTSATTSLLGAVVIGNGTAATSIGMGAGNINAGGVMTASGSTAAVSSQTGAIVQNGGTAATSVGIGQGFIVAGGQIQCVNSATLDTGAHGSSFGGSLTVATALSTTNGNITAAATGSSVAVMINGGTGHQANLFWQVNSVSQFELAGTTAALTLTDSVNTWNPLVYTAGAVGAGFITYAGTLDASSSTVAANVMSGGLAVAKQIRNAGACTLDSGANGSSFGGALTITGVTTQTGNELIGGGIADNHVASSSWSTTGSSTIAAGVWTTINTNTATIASYTLTMPASPHAGQVIEITSSGIVTTFTLSANSGQTIQNAPAALAAGVGVTYVYNGTVWTRLH